MGCPNRVLSEDTTLGGTMRYQIEALIFAICMALGPTVVNGGHPTPDPFTSRGSEIPDWHPRALGTQPGGGGEIPDPFPGSGSRPPEWHPTQLDPSARGEIPNPFPD